MGNIIEYPNPRPLEVCKGCDEAEWKIVIEDGKATLICASCGRKTYYLLED